MNKTQKSLFVAYGFLVFFMALWINPHLLRGDILKADAGSDGFIWPTVLLNTAKWDDDGTVEMYRQDPNRNATFLVKNFPNKLKKIWSTESLNVGIHSASKASPISDGKYIFVGSDSSWFYCYNINGTLNWKFFLGSSMQGIHSSAASDSDNVYIGSYRGSLYSIQKKSGLLNWTVTLGSTIGASPVIVNNEIVVAVETFDRNGFIVKLDRASGKVVWKSEYLKEQSHSSPIYDSKNNSIILGVNNSTVQSFDFNSGKRLWTTPVGGPVKSTMVLFEGHLYGTTWGKEFIKLNASTGTIEWVTPVSETSQVSPVILKGSKIVVGATKDGILYGIDSQTGSIVWEQKPNIKSQISSPIVLRSGEKEKVLYYCSTNNFCLLNSKGILEKTWSVEGEFTGSPLVIDNQMYLLFNDGPLVSYSF